jgi:hypothetical protein
MNDATVFDADGCCEHVPVVVTIECNPRKWDLNQEERNPDRRRDEYQS